MVLSQTGARAGTHRGAPCRQQRRAGSPPRPPRGLLLRTGLLGLLGLLALNGAGCGGEAPRPLTVRWRLLDERTCFEAGVVLFRFSIRGGALESSEATARCSRDPRQQQVTLAGALPGATLLGEASSISEAPLYRGELRLPSPLAAEQELALRFTGGL